MQSTDIVPHNENVLVEIETQSNKNGLETDKKLASKNQVEFYIGKVLSKGNTADSNEQCPGLKVGDKVTFNQFAGSACPTGDVYTKIVRGDDIVAIFDNDKIIPTNDRILVQILDEGVKNQNGLDYIEESDPREKQTQRGKIIGKGKNAISELEVGSIVHFDPYCGNLIVNDNELKLKTIRSFDILFSIK